MSDIPLLARFPIRPATTMHGRPGVAIYAFNEHSKSWQPCGVIFTGPHAEAEALAARRELIEEIAVAGISGELQPCH